MLGFHAFAELASKCWFVLDRSFLLLSEVCLQDTEENDYRTVSFIIYKLTVAVIFSMVQVNQLSTRFDYDDFDLLSAIRQTSKP